MSHEERLRSIGPVRGALAAAATMLLVAPAQALAITDEEIGNLSETQPSGNGTPSLSEASTPAAACCAACSR